MLALRLGCQASDQISSVASNAAALGNVNRWVLIWHSTSRVDL